MISTPADSKPCTVLVVEDSDPIRARLLKHLAEALPKARIEGVGNAVDAVQHFSSYEQRDVVLFHGSKAERPPPASIGCPDVVVLDLELPGCNGLNLLRAIKRVHPGLGAIIFTCLDSDAVRRACMEMGADFFISKSEDIVRLDAAVRTLAARHTFRPEASAWQPTHDPSL